MLTGRGDDMDRILGLELGADDYVPKPLHPPRTRGCFLDVVFLIDNATTSA